MQASATGWHGSLMSGLHIDFNNLVPTATRNHPRRPARSSHAVRLAALRRTRRSVEARSRLRQRRHVITLRPHAERPGCPGARSRRPIFHKCADAGTDRIVIALGYGAVAEEVLARSVSPSDVAVGYWRGCMVLYCRPKASPRQCRPSRALNFPPTTKDGNPLGVISEGSPWSGPVLIVPRNANRLPQ
jgi:hypothetical protein